ncbi:MAG: Unknown protein [uncultured Sulfurovum sp.]|uniref:Uncharacterized protein n=1 Tax=uncultured Sulfurovum sp. TaxID=269237 RepID=A0A6S6TX22_9BACT|nr:MAG: Unknown protein [uncultured Sulfurovum sp.]
MLVLLKVEEEAEIIIEGQEIAMLKMEKKKQNERHREDVRNISFKKLYFRSSY